MVVSVFCAMLGSTLDTCRLVRCNVRVHSSSCGVPLDGCTIVATTIVVTSYSSSPECSGSAAPWCCENVCVAMSCGGGFTPGGAYDSVWDSVKPMTGNYLINYFQYQEDVGCVCTLNSWISCNDEIYPDNYNYFWDSVKPMKENTPSIPSCTKRTLGASACSMTGTAATTLFAPTTTTSRFKLKGKGRSVKWEVFLYDGMSIYVDCDRAEVLPRGVLPALLCNDRCRGWSRQLRPLLELLLDKVVDMPVGVQRQLLVSTCRKLRSIRSFSSLRDVTG